MCFYSFVKGFGILCLIQQFPEVGKSKILVASFIDKKEKTQNCFLCHASSLSHAWLCNPMDCSLPGSSVHRDSPGRNTRVGCHALLWGIFPNQGSNPGLLHCRWIPYHPSHQGSPRTVEWVAYPFSRWSSQPRNQARVSCVAGGFFTSWASGQIDGEQKNRDLF